MPPDKDFNFAPLVLIAFNRPELLRQQLEVIRDHYHGVIYAVVDGPRLADPGEGQRVNEVVELLEGLQDKFEVNFNRSSKNMGCHQRVKTGLDWVFSNEEKAMILEDDCIPSPQFFSFASEMLQRYQNDDQVYSISGTNLFPRLSPEGQGMFLSRYHSCWGWATWSRAWAGFVDREASWLSIRNSSGFREVFGNTRSFLYWRKLFDLTYSGKLNSWAYRWMLSCWMNDGLSICAHANLISNLGDDDDATRTANSSETRRPIGNLDNSLLQLRNPPEICDAYDKRLEDQIYSKSFFYRMRWIYRTIKKKIKSGK